MLIHRISIFECAGILKAYRSCVPHVHFDKTTKFTPIIQRVIDSVRAQDNHDNYHILLILTNGTISDLEETTQVRTVVYRLNKTREYLPQLFYIHLCMIRFFLIGFFSYLCILFITPFLSFSIIYRPS